MDIIQEAKEYIANHKLPESTNAGLNLISKLLDRLERQDEFMFRLVDWTEGKDVSMSSSYECGCRHLLYGNKAGGEAKFCKEHIPPLLAERVIFWQPTGDK